jgi:hypothetical protein
MTTLCALTDPAACASKCSCAALPAAANPPQAQQQSIPGSVGNTCRDSIHCLSSPDVSIKSTGVVCIAYLGDDIQACATLTNAHEGDISEFNMQTTAVLMCTQADQQAHTRLRCVLVAAQRKGDADQRVQVSARQRRHGVACDAQSTTVTATQTLVLYARYGQQQQRPCRTAGSSGFGVSATHLPRCRRRRRPVRCGCRSSPGTRTGTCPRTRPAAMLTQDSAHRQLPVQEDAAAQHAGRTAMARAVSLSISLRHRGGSRLSHCMSRAIARCLVDCLYRRLQYRQSPIVRPS